ncbi:MAG: C_GCAxxG_C_C family protein [Spirochaetales bacterium]|nr:C_GCAxxG_C_C family protein [Spirochaetales bacterium]
MNYRIEKAISLFTQGFNCSQAIFAAYAPYYGIEEKIALKIATGFGAGMGFLQNTCGAVTGAFMLFGLVEGKWKVDDNAAKDKTYSLIRGFEQKFSEINKSINCRTLLDCDLSTQEGRLHARESGIFETKCKKYIRDAATIIESMLQIPKE